MNKATLLLLRARPAVMFITILCFMGFVFVLMRFFGERLGLILGGTVLTALWLFWPYSVAVQSNGSVDNVTLTESKSEYGNVSGLNRVKHAALFIGILSGLAALIMAFFSDASSGVLRLFITLFVLSYLVCLHYMTLWAARILLSLEGKPDATCNHSQALHWQFLFSPLGLWWLQPRLNAVFGADGRQSKVD